MDRRANAMLPAPPGHVFAVLLTCWAAFCWGALGHYLAVQKEHFDLATVVMGLDGDYSPRRLERYLTMIEESGARPAVVLNKTDLCSEVAARVGEARALGVGAPVLAVSALDGPLESLELLLSEGETMALVGSSGAGKTTLTNRLLGDADLPTRPVRAHDSRGRHTTTHRELFRLPGGGLLIDNPGLREVQPWSAASATAGVFPEITELARACRFTDCSHDTEPGCAVRQAIDDDELDPARLAGLRRIEQEAAALELRKDVRASRERDKRLSKLYRSVVREKRSRRG